MTVEKEAKSKAEKEYMLGRKGEKYKRENKGQWEKNKKRKNERKHK